MREFKLLKNIRVYDVGGLEFEATSGADIEDAVEDAIKYLAMNNREGFYTLKFNNVKLQVNAFSIVHRVLEEYFDAVNNTQGANI